MLLTTLLCSLWLLSWSEAEVIQDIHNFVHTAECLYNRRLSIPTRNALSTLQQLYALQPDLHLSASQKPPIWPILRLFEAWILSVIQAFISAF